MVSKELCYIDVPYDWMDDWNTLSLEQPWVKDALLIFDNFWFDSTICSLLYLYHVGAFGCNTVFLSLMLNSVSKAFIQDNLFTIRQARGANWYFPGLYSALVPFHDAEDLYFSGHISTTVVFLYAAFMLKRRYPCSKFACFVFWFILLFRLPYLWFELTVVRTHYFIDDATAVAYGCVATIFAEKVSYCIEVLILGTRTRTRELLYHRPCPRCGWSNKSPLNLIDLKEQRA